MQKICYLSYPLDSTALIALAVQPGHAWTDADKCRALLLIIEPWTNGATQRRPGRTVAVSTYVCTRRWLTATTMYGFSDATRAVHWALFSALR
jgi:hypothetical protein